MFGPGIVARTMSSAMLSDQFGNHWQYLSRGDHHSKVACWGILFDLLQHSRVLADHVLRGEVVFGINHKMVDFKNNRAKDLDLVLAVPGSGAEKKRKAHTLVSFAEKHNVVLAPGERKILASLPALREGPAGSVRLALEAKACMTAHVKALPRLYDELNSSHLTVHGATDIGIAAGFIMVNAASEFISTDMNRFRLSKAAANVSVHKQPRDSERVVEKMLQMPRRTEPGATGFDALAVCLVECKNDGTPVKLWTKPPSPQAGDVMHYDSMIRRTAQLYDFKFGRS
ncbi:MAG: hypothetical protein IT370_25800 [Deltaproteobacteria bacterium]|nr:hypothetical protein [Deltaproteobacteria bacterium]